MQRPEILSVAWDDLQAWLPTVAEQLEVDTIIGISRSGLPIAVALSYLLPQASLATLERNGPRGIKPPLYDFQADRSERQRLLRTAFSLSSSLRDAKRIVIVDDVATFGDTLAMAAAKVTEAAPDASLRFCCYAADKRRLELTRFELARELLFAIEIDNECTWVSFPWTLTPRVRA